MDLMTFIKIVLASGCVGAGLFIVTLIAFAIWLKYGDKEK